MTPPEAEATTDLVDEPDAAAAEVIELVEDPIVIEEPPVVEEPILPEETPSAVVEDGTGDPGGDLALDG